MAASDYVPIFFKNRLHLLGRPQMGSRPGYPGHYLCNYPGTASDASWETSALRSSVQIASINGVAS